MSNSISASLSASVTATMTIAVASEVILFTTISVSTPTGFSSAIACQVGIQTSCVNIVRNQFLANNVSNAATLTMYPNCIPPTSRRRLLGYSKMLDISINKTDRLLASTASVSYIINVLVPASQDPNYPFSIMQSFTPSLFSSSIIPVLASSSGLNTTAFAMLPLSTGSVCASGVSSCVLPSVPVPPLLTTGAIIGVVIGALVLVSLLIYCIILQRRLRRLAAAFPPKQLKVDITPRAKAYNVYKSKMK
jgi:hypothetical protein